MPKARKRTSQLGKGGRTRRRGASAEGFVAKAVATVAARHVKSMGPAINKLVNDARAKRGLKRKRVRLGKVRISASVGGKKSAYMGTTSSSMARHSGSRKKSHA